MTGILWRILGDDGVQWSSPEAWSVVADACEDAGLDGHASRVRQAVAEALTWDPPPPPTACYAAARFAVAWADLPALGVRVPAVVRDTDAASLRVEQGGFLQPPKVTRRTFAWMANAPG